jgi:hypothetical protein
MLDKLHYDTYNRKFGNDGMHTPLDWDDYKDEMETFKHEQVFANIARTEIESMEMQAWIETLTVHSYDIKLPISINNPTKESKTELDFSNAQDSKTQYLPDAKRTQNNHEQESKNSQSASPENLELVSKKTLIEKTD